MKLEIILIRVKEHYGQATGAGVAVPDMPIGMMKMASGLKTINVETSDEEYMETVAKKLRDQDLQVSWELLDGNPGYRTAKFARKTDHNMVALATRGHSGVERWIEGSVAEVVILGSRDPVLIIPPLREDVETG
jgi:nucleotide-binding universal stress UspA family protein